MTNLSDQQIKFYNEKGYIAPIDVLSIQEANEIREEIETIEKKWPNSLEGLGRNYVHMISPVMNNVCLNNKVLEKLYNDKIILDHGMKVGSELANVLSGGDTTIKQTLSEDELYKLELESFMKLIETKETQERIKHTLNTGKLLVN